MRFFIAQIPDEAIQTGFRLDLLFRLLLVGIEGFFERLVSALEYLRITLPDASRISSFVSVPGFGASFR